MPIAPLVESLYAGLSASEIELLKLRAERYARATTEASRDAMETVLFTRGSGRYGVVLSTLREIRPLTNLTLLPGASAVVPGVFYYRGELLSAHDLAAFMSPATRPAPKPGGWILIVEHEGERLGLIADAVNEIRAVQLEALHPLPLTLGDRSTCFQGVLEDGLLLLHTPVLFASPRFFSAF